MAGSRKERGEHRGIYTTLADDPDFIALSPPAKLLWYTLKMTLGASGIGVAYVGQLADMTALGQDQVVAGLGELEEAGWLVRERNVMWLRNGLRFDPYFSLDNAPHMAAVEKHLASLPKLKVVNDFRAYYGMPDEPDETPPSPTPPQAPPEAPWGGPPQAPPQAPSPTPPEAGEKESRRIGDKSFSPPHGRAREGGASIRGYDELAAWLGPHAGSLDRFVAAADANCTAVDSIRATFSRPSMEGDRVWGTLAPGDRPPILASALEAVAGEGQRYQAKFFRKVVQDRISEYRNGDHGRNGAGAGKAKPGKPGRGGPDLATYWGQPPNGDRGKPG